MVLNRKITSTGIRARPDLAIAFSLVICFGTPGLSCAETYLYWVNAGANKIQRANLDGTDVTDILNVGGVQDVAVDATNEKIYWTVRNDKIQRANLDGSSIEDVVTGLGAQIFVALDVDDNRIYWSESNPWKLSRANLDGTNTTTLITATADIKYPKFIALDLTNNKIFYRANTPSNTDYKIRRANLDGSGIESNYISGQLNNGVEGIAVDPTNSKIYWAGRDSEKIYRANLNGAGQTDLVTGLTDPMGIALDLVNNKIYWCDEGTDKIHRANLSDGSGKEDVVTGLNNPEGITIATIASSNGASVSSADEIRYVPFASKYLLMGLMALLGGWLVLRRH